MFGLGLPEIGIIAVVALLIFGPKKIPEMGRAMGKTIRGFKEEMNTESESEVDSTSEANPSDSPKS